MKINPVTVNKKVCVLPSAQGVELVNSNCPRLKQRDLEMEMFDRVIMQLYSKTSTCTGSSQRSVPFDPINQSINRLSRVHKSQ